MPHNYNRVAFQGGIAGVNALLSLYCSLVDLELALKNHFWPNRWRGGHAIIDWITELGEAALAAQLVGRLAHLQCTGGDGTVTAVAGNSYPGMRYLRHEQDWPGASTDTQLREALDVVDDVKTALRAKGVNV
jgi:hypothetical protein